MPMSMKSGINLSTKQKKELQQFAKKPRDSREYRSALGILSRSEGKSAQDVANQFNVTKKQVFTWCKKYRQNGLSGLRMRKQTGRPAVQGNFAKKYIPALLQQEPQAFGFLKGRWVVRDIAKALKKEGVYLSFQSVSRILHDMKMTLKRPRLRAPGSIHKNYRKREQIRRYKKIAPTLLKKESALLFKTRNG